MEHTTFTAASSSGSAAPRTDDGSWIRETLREKLDAITDAVEAFVGVVCRVSVVDDQGQLELLIGHESETVDERPLGTGVPLEWVERCLSSGTPVPDCAPDEQVRLAPGTPAPPQWPLALAGAPADHDPAATPWLPERYVVQALSDRDGRIIGVLWAVLPDDDEQNATVCRGLRISALQASRAISTALERARLTRQVELAQAARTILRHAKVAADLDQLLDGCVPAIVQGFGARGLSVRVLPDESGAFAGGHLSTLPGPLAPMSTVDAATRIATRLWSEHRVLTTTLQPDAPEPPEHPEPDVRAWLALCDRDPGVARRLLVPLGVGARCVGALLLVRAHDDAPWSRIETDIALDLGADLGAILATARTLHRERRLVNELQQLDSYRSQLLATVSHELRNPLAAISGHLALLDLDADEATAVSLRAIGRASGRLQQLVEDLLALARVDNPADPLVATPVDLRMALDAAADLAAPQAAVKDIELQVRTGRAPAVVSGARAELDTVLANLLSNAVKYTPAGGRVEVDLTTPDDGWVRVSVRDDGIGISAMDQQRLFKEFFRSSDPDVLREQGTGLGLAIVERIVRRHGGRIAVTSEPGQGSRFDVDLPAG